MGGARVHKYTNHIRTADWLLTEGVEYANIFICIHIYYMYGVAVEIVLGEGYYYA